MFQKLWLPYIILPKCLYRVAKVPISCCQSAYIALSKCLYCIVKVPISCCKTADIALSNGYYGIIEKPIWHFSECRMKMVFIMYWLSDYWLKYSKTRIFRAKSFLILNFKDMRCSLSRWFLMTERGMLAVWVTGVLWLSVYFWCSGGIPAAFIAVGSYVQVTMTCDIRLLPPSPYKGVHRWLTE